MSKEIALRMARDNFAAYCLLVSPGYQLPPHLQHLAAKLSAVAKGEIDRLMIAMPPRHGKTMMASTIFTSWYIGQPEVSGDEIVIATYGQRLTKKISRAIRDILNLPIYRAIFPEIELDDDNQSAYEMSYRNNELEVKGQIFATSVGAGLTGMGAGLAIIDDAYKDRQDAESEAIIEATNEWYDSALYTRLSPTGKILLIGTRWSTYDLHAHAMEAEPWHKVEMPALDDNGKALWPERFSAASLRRTKRVMGEYDFEALYQGNPQPRGGGMLKPDLIQKYHVEPKFDRLIISADTAIKTGKANDYSVAAVMGLVGSQIYVIALWRDRVEYPTLKKVLVKLYQMYKPSVVHVEDKASGQQVLQELHAILPLSPLKAIGDKVQRAQALADAITTGTLFFPYGASWIADANNELRSFPTGKHDDICDSLAYGVAALREIDAFRYFDEIPMEDHVSHPPAGWPTYRSGGHEGGRTTLIWWTVAIDTTPFDDISYAVGTIIVIQGIETERPLPSIIRLIASMELKHGLIGSEGSTFWTKDGKIDLMIICPELYDLFLEPMEDITNALEILRDKLSNGQIVISSVAKDIYRNLAGCSKDPNHPEKIKETIDTVAVHTMAQMATTFEGEEVAPVPILEKIGDQFKHLSEGFGK